MAIFSRRTVQRMLRENATFLTKKQLREFAQKLNKADERSLHTEWELVLLNVFSKIGQVEHERQYGAKFPDIYLSTGCEVAQTLICDVRTVSDKGLLPESLVELFKKRLRHELGKRRLKFEHFSCEFKRIGSDTTIDAYMTSHLFSFLDAIAQARKSPANYISEDQTIALKYDPAQTSYTWSAPITSAKKLSNNPFYNALNDKLDQLEASGFMGARGIILCDGGSNMFFFRKGDVLHYGSDEVINNFLRAHRHIDFVMTVWVDRVPETSQDFRLYKVRAQLFQNDNFSLLDEKIRHGLLNVENLFPLAPVTVDIALSSINEGRGKQRWGFHYWKSTMSEDKKQIKISAIGLLQLLAGQIKQDVFLEEQGFKAKGEETSVDLNPFLRHFRSGITISGVSLERSELDDDYVVVTFEGKDAALSAYQVDAPPTDAAT